MLLTKLILNSTFRKCSFGNFFLNYESKFAPYLMYQKLHILNQLQKIGANEVPCNKGAVTVMNRCLDEPIDINKTK